MLPVISNLWRFLMALGSIKIINANRLWDLLPGRERSDSCYQVPPRMSHGSTIVIFVPRVSRMCTTHTFAQRLTLCGSPCPLSGRSWHSRTSAFLLCAPTNVGRRMDYGGGSEKASSLLCESCSTTLYFHATTTPRLLWLLPAMTLVSWAGRR